MFYVIYKNQNRAVIRLLHLLLILHFQFYEWNFEMNKRYNDQ